MRIKRCVTLPSVYCRPFASRVVFCGTANSKSFNIAQNTTSEAKGRQFTEGKVTQRLFSFDKCTYLAIYHKFPPG